jgi:FtsH-binding integral membrane protein
MALGIAMRWVHIASVVTLLGGFIFARFALAPALASLPENDRNRLSSKVAQSFRGLLYTVIAAILVSGLYNYLSKATRPPGYDMWIGIKFLLVLHVFAVSLLYAFQNTDEAKRSRRALGIAISGLVIVLISGYLRWISLNPR